MNENLSKLIINKVYFVTTMYNEKGAYSKRKNRPNWAVVIKYEGETVYYQGERKIISNYNNPVILPKGSNYEWKCTESGHYIVIEFQSELESEEILAFNVKNPEKLLNTFKNLKNKMLLKNAFFEIESVKDTYSVILSLAKNGEYNYIPSSKKRILTPVIEYIAENYSEKITNDTLASLTGFSTVYFRKLFKEIYGCSPIEYVKQLKIKKAKEMLRSDYSGITEIANSLGYQNIYDFSRDFKKHTGVAPSKYIK